MRTPVAVALAVVVVGTVVGGVAVYGLLLSDDAVEVAWVTETATGTDSNHHRAAVVEAEAGPIVAVPLAGPDGSERCRVAAFDAEGEPRWQFQVPPEGCRAGAVGDVSTGSFPGEQPSLLVASGERRVHALAPGDGSERFAHDLAAAGYSSPTVVGGDLLVVADSSGTVVAVERDGTERWRADVNGEVRAAPTTVEVAGEPTVLVGSDPDADEGTLASFAADGTRRFTAAFESGVTGIEPTVVGGEPAVVVATRGGTVAAVSAIDGEPLWVRDLPEDARIALGNQRAFVAHGEPTVRALSLADGRTLWETAVGDGGASPSSVTVAEFDAVAPAPVVATPDGEVAVLSPRSGDVLASHDTGATLHVAPTPADVTGDGADDLVVVYGDGRTALLTVDLEE